jgi:FKBP-type peptidyl-prolyl cis-trans isomerase
MKIFLTIFLSTFALLVYSQKTRKTSTGYEYRFEKRGDGVRAQLNSYVYFTSQIKGDNGKVLETLGEGPNMPVMFLDSALFPALSKINPLLEVLQESRIGDVIVFVMPVDSIPNPNDETKEFTYLEYYMTIKNVTDQTGYDRYLLEIEKNKEKQKQEGLKKLPGIEKLVHKTVEDYRSGTLKISQTPSGLGYLIIEDGKGDNIKKGQTVVSNYYGVLKDGTAFDNSYKRGGPFDFEVGKGMVIKGWDEGVLLFREGTKAFLFIPAILAYGVEAQSSIPANSELIFYIEIIGAK